jgi:hypothetical protein
VWSSEFEILYYYESAESQIKRINGIANNIWFRDFISEKGSEFYRWIK